MISPSNKRIKSIMFGFRTAKSKKRIRLFVVAIGMIIFFLCLSTFSVTINQNSSLHYPDTNNNNNNNNNHKSSIPNHAPIRKDQQEKLERKKVLETSPAPNDRNQSPVKIQNNKNNNFDYKSKPPTPSISPNQQFFNNLPPHIQQQVKIREKQNYAINLKYDSNGIIPSKDFFDGLDATFEVKPLFKKSLVRKLFNIDQLNNLNKINNVNNINNKYDNNNNNNNINSNNKININNDNSNNNDNDNSFNHNYLLYDNYFENNNNIDNSNINNNNNNNNNNINFINELNEINELKNTLLKEYDIQPKNYKVTIVTQTTVDRLYKVALMASRWKSPISVSLYIKSQEDIQKLEDSINSSPILSVFADFHLFYRNNTRYPVNNLRNLAIKNALTDHVLLLDVDFIPPNHLHDHIASYLSKNTIKINSSPSSLNAFVIPSFSSNLKPDDIPNSKYEFIEKLNQDLIVPSNLKVCPKCHSPTNYQKWISSNESYEIEYHWIYEPFLVYNRSETIQFDERFKGYGFDKNSHIFVMAAQGFKFTVLPNAYIVHINHPSSRWDGPSLDDQQWDSLRIVCDLIPEVRAKYANNVPKLFDEPSVEECYSNSHW